MNDIPDIDMGLGDMNLDLAAFDMGADDKPERIETRYCKPRIYRHVKATAVKYDRAKDLVMDMLPAIVAGERIDALVSGNFIFGDVFEALAVQANITIDRLIISTLAMSQENVDSLHNLLTGGYLDKLDLLVSDYFWSHNRASAPYIYEKLDIGDRFQLAVAGVHAKVALIETEGRKIVMTGSANLRSARCIEVFTIETNPDLFDFHAEWIGRLMTAYATIRKGIRAGDAFNLIKD